VARGASWRLWEFIMGGWSQKAVGAGWTEGELFATPPVWGRVDLTGVGLLVGDHKVVDVDATAITVETQQGSRLKIYRNDTLKGGTTREE
jgi:hypothetical protein